VPSGREQYVVPTPFCNAQEGAFGVKFLNVVHFYYLIARVVAFEKLLLPMCSRREHLPQLCRCIAAGAA
jgi:hypothetical protein